VEVRGEQKRRKMELKKKKKKFNKAWTLGV
jgi:hypothetical protein